MTAALHTLAHLRECLAGFSKSLKATQGARTLPQEMEALFAELKEVERHHIECALADSSFPFERVQAELTECFRQFARTMNEVRAGHAEAFDKDQRKRLADLILIGSYAEVTSPADLEAIRAAHVERARLSAV